MSDYKALIYEARKRDKEVLGHPGILTQLANALEASQTDVRRLKAKIKSLTPGEEEK